MDRSKLTNGLGLALLFWAGALTTARAAQLEILGGSTVTVLGTQKTVPLQSIPIFPAPGAASYRTADTVRIPRLGLAFGEFVDLGQNQEAIGVLNQSTGRSTLDFRLWIVDSLGNRRELPVTLTTEVPTATDCAGNRYCFGGPGDLPHCQGTAWNPSTGDVEYVAAVRVPFGSGTLVDCEGIAIRINARILPGDPDGDLIQSAIDKCPTVSNASQPDGDADGIGTSCDNCSTTFNPNQADMNSDGIGNACQPIKVNFQPPSPGSPIPAGYQEDNGLTYSPARGYGWLGAGTLLTRDRGILADQRLDTFAFTTPQRSWERTIAGGFYDVQLAIGDPQFAQGPQRVISEGTTAFDNVTTAPGANNLTANLARQFVADGRLTETIGGLSGNTAINYVTATESQNPPFYGRYVNFQPAASPVPLSFIPDSGALYTSAAGFGWDGAAPVPVRDRVSLGNPVLDTHAYVTAETRSWKISLPSDFYQVQIGVGDATAAQGPAVLLVEGTTWLPPTQLLAGEFLTLSGRVRIVDGFLDLTVGDAAGTTPIVYVSIAALPKDLDADGTNNLPDNCIDVPNPTQVDSDHNGVGDLCNSFEDADNDEWSDLLDNCPALSNGNQADTDGNGVGDACNSAEDSDGDEFADSLDNCPAISNPSQANADGDAAGDPCDCAPAQGGAFALVGEVQNLVVSGPETSQIAWDSQSTLAGTGTVYDVMSEPIPDLSVATPFQAASCFANDVAAATVNDARMPGAGTGYLYLVRAHNACGAGNYGTEIDRVPLNSSGVCP